MAQPCGGGVLWWEIALRGCPPLLEISLVFHTLLSVILNFLNPIIFAMNTIVKRSSLAGNAGYKIRQNLQTVFKMQPLGYPRTYKALQ